jgi:hypothetical protein
MSKFLSETKAARVTSVLAEAVTPVFTVAPLMAEAASFAEEARVDG